jgi:hypothetical protein
VLTLFLDSACKDVPCPTNQTCSSGSCKNVDVDVSGLPAYDPNAPLLPPDAGASPVLDGGAEIGTGAGGAEAGGVDAMADGQATGDSAVDKPVDVPVSGPDSGTGAGGGDTGTGGTGGSRGDDGATASTGGAGGGGGGSGENGDAEVPDAPDDHRASGTDAFAETSDAGQPVATFDAAADNALDAPVPVDYPPDSVPDMVAEVDTLPDTGPRLDAGSEPTPDASLDSGTDAPVDVATGAGSKERIIYYKSPAPFSIYYANLDGTGETPVALNAVSNNGDPVGYGGGKICYHNGTSLVVANWDGTSSQTVPNTTDVGGEVDCSPDGSKVAYAGGSNNFNLFMIATDGSGKVTFNDGSAVSKHQLFPSWNVLGRIVFGQSNFGNPYTQALYWKADDQPASTAQLLRPAFAQYPESGGPGGRIAYNDQPGNLFVMDSDGNNVLALTVAGVGNFGNKAWSDATGALFFEKAGDVWRINPDNTGLAKVLADGNVKGVLGVVLDSAAPME